MHLKSLHIKNFRALEDFQVNRLGRVNLIVGKNNSGKSSVLEALQIFAGNAHPALLEKIAQSHDEVWRRNDETLDAQESFPFKSFFSGRMFPNSDDVAIEIGDGTTKNSVKIEHGFYFEESITDDDVNNEDRPRTRRTRVFKKELNNYEGEPLNETMFIQANGLNPIIMRFDGLRGRFWPYPIQQKSKPCSYIPTQFISTTELADEWDKIGLTDAQDFVKNALRIISPDFQDILFVRSDDDDGRSSRFPRVSRSLSRNAIVKLKDQTEPVPLNSMGDGMFRVLQLFLKLFTAKGGFLLIDEFENGLHFSIQEQVWGLLFDLAEQNDVQVFATTHSWDCIESFAKVAREKIETEGVLFRVGKSVRTSDKGKVIATVFDEEKLFNITQSDVEVR